MRPARLSKGGTPEKPAPQLTGSLAVTLDGVPLAEAEARAIWQRFSAYMEEHKGDLAGFARAEGYASVHPTPEGGKAVLVLSRSKPQEAYGAVPPPPVKAGSRRRR